MDEPEDSDGQALELVVAVDPRELQQDEGQHCVARGCRLVLEVLLARDELLAVGGREVEAAALLVPEELDREARQSVRLLEPAQLARGDVQLEQAVRNVGVVLEVAGSLGPAGAEGPVQPAFAGRERAEQELAERAGRVEVVGALEAAAGLRQRREREPVPGRDRLVVPLGLRPLLAQLEEPGALLVGQVRRG